MAEISGLNGQGRCGLCVCEGLEDGNSARTKTGYDKPNGSGRSTDTTDMMADMFMAMMTMMNTQLMLSSAQQSNVWNDL